MIAVPVITKAEICDHDDILDGVAGTPGMQTISYIYYHI